MWILIPESALYRLDHTQIGNRVLATIRDSLASQDFPSTVSTKTSVASFQLLPGAQGLLVGAWGAFAGATIAPIRPRGENILSLWAGEGTTLWSFAAEENQLVFHRLVDLAQRVWTSQPFPQSWQFKKVGELPSIFAADRKLADMRVAYQSRNIGGVRILEVGTIYKAYHGTGTISPTDGAVLEAIPAELATPESVLTAHLDATQGADDGDLIIRPPDGESRHLFAMPYPAWMDPDGPLTRQQRRVVTLELARPLRIHGPAGSGKTLVLILKTLRLLREAKERPCRILFVANSTSMRTTIRAAIEAIDDRSFLATTRTDLQFLDVETLHGWCIRELGGEIGLRYVVNEDPTLSREAQNGILTEITNSVFADKYEKLKEFLSEDFKLRWERKPDDFIRQLGWEIAIRIKGSGLRRGEKDLATYVKSPVPSFIGRRENGFDRRLLFHVFSAYEEHFSRRSLLDTDDIVLSMSARLKASLWDRQRRAAGYDFVMVDEAHLFNENERRVLPYLTRGVTEFVPLVLTFDEAQSIGGSRGTGLEELGFENRKLKYVHRSSPDIVALARYVRERGSLLFVEFGAEESEASMSEKETKRCRRPAVLSASGKESVARTAVQACEALRSTNYPRIAVICFDNNHLAIISRQFASIGRPVHEVRARGDVLAALPRAGYYLMTPELCGGLEFDAVVLLGVDDGRVPPEVAELSPEGQLAIEEESHKELYTAITRARYRVVFVCDSEVGPSQILRPALAKGLITSVQKAESL